MIYDTQDLRWTAAVVFALLFMMMHPAPAGADDAVQRLTREVETRVEEMNAAIEGAAAEAGVAETDMDVSGIPGRDSFITWALEKIDAMEQAGYIISDEVFLAEAETGARLPSAGEGCRAAVLLFKSLGRLKAEEAVPALSRFMLKGPGIGVTKFGRWRDAWPVCGALAAIGRPALPAILPKAREADHPKLTRLCATVIGTILGEEGPDWLDRQIALETAPDAKLKLEAMRKEIELCAWQARAEREKAEREAAREAEIREQQLENEVFE